jgi:hypothetical protein
MVGGLGGGGKARRGYGPGGHLARPSSVGDFNEMEEDGWSINQMPDHEVPEEFEKMLENMNLSKVSTILMKRVENLKIINLIKVSLLKIIVAASIDS